MINGKCIYQFVSKVRIIKIICNLFRVFLDFDTTFEFTGRTCSLFKVEAKSKFEF